MKGQNGNGTGHTNGLQHRQVAVVMVPFPAQGHLNQLLHLSHFIASYGLPVYYTGSSKHNRQAQLRLQGWHPEEENSGNRIRFHDFELPPYDMLSPVPNPSMHFPGHLQPLWNASLHFQQPVFQFLQQISTGFRRVVVIYDCLMASVVQDVKLISNAEAFNFWPSSVFGYLVLRDIMNQKLPSELDVDDIPGGNVTLTEGCFTPELEDFLARQQQITGVESGVLYNTSRVIEGKYFNLLEKISDMKSFAIGPFLPTDIKDGKSRKKRHTCLEWLDKQEKDSVLYVSFGSMTSIINEQIKELAIGLERSGHKFIWVLKDADKADVFAQKDAERRMELPEGYEERVSNRGLLVRDWAPQLEILAHSSVGGFMSHCGWNSCLESISMGVAMATWPMHSDQPRNALLVTDVLKIGTAVRHWTGHGEVVSSTSVEDAVRRLMESEEGKGIRKRAAELGDAVRRSVSPGGSSRLEMDSFIAHITR